MKIPSKAKSILMDLSMILLIFIGVINYCNARIQKLAHFSWGGPFNIVNIAIVLIFIIIITGIDHKVSIKDLKFNPFFWVGWYLCFGFMFGTSLINEVRFTYFTWSIVSLFVYPLIFITWADNYKKFATIVAKNTVVVTYIFILMNLIITPLTTRDTPYDGYLGVVSNPNANGMLVTAMYAASLFMLLTSKKGKMAYVIPTAFTGVMPIVAGCRSAELAVMLETLAALIYYIKCVKAGALKTSAAKVIAICLSVALIGGAFGYVLNAMDTVDINTYAETGDEAYANLPNDFVRKLDTLSSGRLIIWVAYAQRATMFGNGNPKEPVIDGYGASMSAHNNSFDILYASGYFAFIGYWMLILAGLWFVIRCIFTRKECHPEYILAMTAFLGYFAEAMLETPMHPFSTNLAVLAYLTLIPIAIRGAK